MENVSFSAVFFSAGSFTPLWSEAHSPRRERKTGFCHRVSAYSKVEQFVPGTALLTLRQCCEPDPRAFAVSVLYDAHIILFKNKTAVSFYLAGDGTVTRGANCAPWSFAGKTRPPEEFSTRLLLQVPPPPINKKKHNRKGYASFCWCGRRDLNPYVGNTRPSNVRVCRFRHSRER